MDCRTSGLSNPNFFQALEAFYAPPSHDRPRDMEGWEMIGLYEWSKAKTAAVKEESRNKWEIADAICKGSQDSLTEIFNNVLRGMSDA